MTSQVVQAIFRLKDEMSGGLARIEGAIGKTQGRLIQWRSIAYTGVKAVKNVLLEHDEAMAVVARGTGATGENLAALQDIATRVGSSLRGDFGATAEGLANLNDSIARSGAEAGGAVVHSAEEIGRQFKGLTADEAAKIDDALINLGSKGNRAFTDVHDSSRAAANAVATLVRKLKKAMEAEWRGTVRMTAVDGGERLAAAGGGVFRGPLSGYPVTLHGTETVVPGAHPGLVARPPAAAAPAAAPSSRAPVQIVIHTDGTHSGRAVARAVARYLPAELRRAGVTI